MAYDPPNVGASYDPYNFVANETATPVLFEQYYDREYGFAVTAPGTVTQPPYEFLQGVFERYQVITVFMNAILNDQMGPAQTFQFATPFAIEMSGGSSNDKWNIVSSMLNGPGAFRIYEVSLHGSDTYEWPVEWVVPDGIAFVNMTNSRVVWVKGQLLMPGATATVWRPGTQTVLSAEGFAGDVAQGIAEGRPALTAQGWPMHVVCSSCPSPVWGSVTMVSSPTLTLLPGNQGVSARAAPRLTAAKSALFAGNFRSEASNQWSTIIDGWNFEGSPYIYPGPAVYAITDTFNSPLGGGSANSSWVSTVENENLPSNTSLRDCIPALTVFNASKYTVTVSYAAYTGSSTPTATTSGYLAPASTIASGAAAGVYSGVMLNLDFMPRFTITILDPSSKRVLDTIYVQVAPTLLNDSNRPVCFGTPQAPCTFGISGATLTAPGAIVADCWPFGSPPTPQINNGSTGLAFTATTSWVRPSGATDTSGASVYPQFPYAANVNVVVRSAPLLNLFAVANPGAVKPPSSTELPYAALYLGSSTSGLPDPTDYLGGLSMAVRVVPGGAVASLCPSSMDDVLVCEMFVSDHTLTTLDCPTASSGQSVPSAIFDTLSLADLQAARSGSAAAGPFNYLPNPVSLTPYLTLFADSGEAVYIMVGPYQVITNQPLGNGGTFTVGVPLPSLPPVNQCPSAAQFVSQVCSVEGFTSCRSVVGTQPSTCLGYFSNAVSAGGVAGSGGDGLDSPGVQVSLTQACSLTCANDTDASANAACRTLALNQCSGPAGISKPECACVRFEESTVPVNVLTGAATSYNQFLQWFLTNFKGGGLPQLLEDMECWWPACATETGALKYYRPCPTDVLRCFALVSQVTATNDSHVNIQLSNACGVSQIPSSGTTGVGGTPAADPTPIPAKAQIGPIIGVVVVAFFIIIAVLALWGAAASRVKALKRAALRSRLYIPE